MTITTHPSPRPGSSPDSSQPTVHLTEHGKLHVGDALATLKTLEAGSVDSCVTSPPYFSLRNYGHKHQIGLESHIQDWVEGILAVTNELHRVLVPTGTLWLNLGDTYSAHQNLDAPYKSLMLAPERIASAMLKRGWVLRNKIAWVKTNPMPSSASDRLTASHEVIYVFAKQSRGYYFDLDSIRIPPKILAAKPRASPRKSVKGREAWRGPNADTTTGLASMKQRGISAHPLGKNPTDAWLMASSTSQGTLRATFPKDLTTRCITASTPAQRCRACRAPYTRQLIRHKDGTATREPAAPTCAHTDAGTEPGVVLDPFMGSGTTAVVAEGIGRRWEGIELNAQFALEALARIARERKT